MTIQSKREVLDVLEMPEETFRRDVAPLARQVCADLRGDRILVSAMLAYTNICRNRCLYCGMRAGHQIPRFRMEPEEILSLARRARESGLGRLFLLAGEDPGYGFDRLAQLVADLHGLGFALSLGAGELERDQYRILRDAGLDEYILKFEMSHPDSFDRLNPSTSFAKRMQGIAWVKEAGLALASGNIVDWPGQSLDELADDILLMRDLDISWAPNIPYLPAAGTPLAEEGGRGSDLLMDKEIALVRLMLPRIKITAQQPGRDPEAGLADLSGNLAAIASGADLLFCDLMPDARADDFRPIDRRRVTGLAHCQAAADRAGLRLDLGGGDAR